MGINNMLSPEAKKKLKAERRAQRRASKGKVFEHLSVAFDKYLEKILDSVKNEYEQKQKANPDYKRTTLPDIVKFVRSTSKNPDAEILQVAADIAQLLFVFRKQLAVSYEIAIANNYQVDKLPREVMLMTAMNAFSEKYNAPQQEVGILEYKEFIQNKDLRKQVIQKIALSFAIIVGSSVVARFVPVKGIDTIVQTIFEALSLKKTSRVADTLFRVLAPKSFQANQDNTPEPVQESEHEAEEQEQVADDTDVEKMHALIALIKKDGVVDDKEKALFESLLTNMGLGQEKLAEAQALLSGEQNKEPNWELIKSHPAEAEAFWIDVLSIAQVDGDLKPEEHQYMSYIAGKLDIPYDEVQEVVG